MKKVLAIIVITMTLASCAGVSYLPCPGVDGGRTNPLRCSK